VPYVIRLFPGSDLTLTPDRTLSMDPVMAEIGRGGAALAAVAWCLLRVRADGEVNVM